MKEEPRQRYCTFDDGEHVWTINRHDESVHCARCMQCLGIPAMLAAYILMHGGEVVIT